MINVRSKCQARGGLTAILMAVLAASIWSCHPGGPTRVEELDTVMTIRDESVQFSAAKTFAMPDTVVHLKEDNNSSPVPIDRQFDGQILSEVVDNMQALGWTRELNPEQNPPDVVLLVSAAAQDNWVAYRRFGWWGRWGFWPGWGPGFGPGWAWRYPVTRVVNYQTGTIFIEMFDPDLRENTEELLPTIWGAAIDGLLRDTDQGTSLRIIRGINQAFRQSSYLALP